MGIQSPFQGCQEEESHSGCGWALFLSKLQDSTGFGYGGVGQRMGPGARQGRLGLQCQEARGGKPGAISDRGRSYSPSLPLSLTGRLVALLLGDKETQLSLAAALDGTRWDTRFHCPCPCLWGNRDP